MHCSTDEEDSSVWRQDDSDEAVVGCVTICVIFTCYSIEITAEPVHGDGQFVSNCHS